MREGIRWAKRYMRGKYGIPDTKVLVEKIPLLEDFIYPGMDKSEIEIAIKNADEFLKKEGWTLLISKALIEVPITRFMERMKAYALAEAQAMSEIRKAKGRGTIMEYEAKKKYDLANKMKLKYAAFIRQLLLANPAYLASIKKNADWLSRERKSMLERIAREVVAGHVKEQLWLKEMQKKMEA